MPLRAVAGGASLPFKLAMWGSAYDERLLAGVAARFSDRTIGAWEVSGRVMISEGLQLRSKPAGEPGDASPPEAGAGVVEETVSGNRETAPESVDPLPEVVRKKALDPKKLRRMGRVYAFPEDAFYVVDEEHGFERRGRGPTPLAVCRPPHVVVSGARTFAVYSDEFLVIPPRQIGVAGKTTAERSWLIALSLYLTSDFATYFEFFYSPQGGIREGRSTLGTLRSLPFPMAGWTEAEFTPWVELHAQLKALPNVDQGQEQPPRKRPRDGQRELPWSGQTAEPPASHKTIKKLRDNLEEKVNALVDAALGLDEQERWLVHDLVQVRMGLADGKLSDDALRPPKKEELLDYATALGLALNEFVDRALEMTHSVAIEHDDRTGVVAITLVPCDADRRSVTADVALPRTARELQKLRVHQEACRKRWIYFDRNLLLDLDDQTFLVKPMQRISWTRSQALLDADEIVARALLPVGR